MKFPELKVDVISMRGSEIEVGFNRKTLKYDL